MLHVAAGNPPSKRIDPNKFFVFCENISEVLLATLHPPLPSPQTLWSLPTDNYPRINFILGHLGAIDGWYDRSGKAVMFRSTYVKKIILLGTSAHHLWCILQGKNSDSGYILIGGSYDD